MTDRALLELAAKAAGYSHASTTDDGLVVLSGVLVKWNPLASDGEALRLAIVLGITIDTPVGAKWVYAGGNSSHSEPSAPDMFAATRRAIVRAAAEIGKASNGN